MRTDYPNLPLIEERFQNAIISRLANKKIEKEKKKEYFFPRYIADVFMQTWPDTSGGFSRPGMCAGSALTSQYTTVIWEQETNTYGVFFGNKLAYIVTAANETFIQNLKDRDMKNIGDAELVY